VNAEIENSLPLSLSLSVRLSLGVGRLSLVFGVGRNLLREGFIVHDFGFTNIENNSI